MKLDYERQCYRHNEIILLNDLEQLQAAVGETIKSVTGNDRSAASAAKGKPAAKQPAAKQQSAAAAQRPLAMQQPAAATQQPLAVQQPAAATQQPLAMQQPAAKEEHDRASRTREAPCAALTSQGRCVGRDPDPRVRSMMSHDAP
jgi:hypothetical protein